MGKNDKPLRLSTVRLSHDKFAELLKDGSGPLHFKQSYPKLENQFRAMIPDWSRRGIFQSPKTNKRRPSERNRVFYWTLNKEGRKIINPGLLKSYTTEGIVINLKNVGLIKVKKKFLEKREFIKLI